MFCAMRGFQLLERSSDEFQTKQESNKGRDLRICLGFTECYSQEIIVLSGLLNLKINWHRSFKRYLRKQCKGLL